MTPDTVSPSARPIWFMAASPCGVGRPPLRRRHCRAASPGCIAWVFRTGFLLNLSNPKMPIFYLALLPGVIGLLLAVIALVELVMVGCYVAGARRARALLRLPRRRRALNRGAGSRMIGACLPRSVR